MFSISQSTVPEIDGVLAAMTDADSGRWLGAREAFNGLRKAARSVPEESLLIELMVLCDY